jgi:putative transposase
MRRCARIERHVSRSHGVPRGDDRRIVSGIIFVIWNGLRWRDAPREYAPHKTIDNRFIRWSRLGVFNRIFAALCIKRTMAVWAMRLVGALVVWVGLVV